MLEAIRTVLRKLPNDVGLFAYGRCVFISIGLGSFGMTLPGRISSHLVDRRTRNMWLIILDERVPDDEVQGTIAHEIAHAWLKHDQISIDIPETCEVDAALLTKSWGFTGKGTDPDYCDRPYRQLHESNNVKS